MAARNLVPPREPAGAIHLVSSFRLNSKLQVDGVGSRPCPSVHDFEGIVPVVESGETANDIYMMHNTVRDHSSSTCVKF